MPSALSHVDFQVGFTVVWLPAASTTERSAAQSAAVNAVVQYAVNVAAAANPLHPEIMAAQLANDLSRAILVSPPGVRAHAEDLSVQVEPEQLELARKHGEIRRERVLRQAERDAEVAEATYLRHTVFGEVGNAVLWWLHKNAYDVERAAKITGQLGELVNVVDSRKEEHWAETLIAVMYEALPDLTVQERLDLHIRLGKILKMYGSDEAAEELAHHADVQGSAP
jgi:hypothetical protein